MLFGRGALAVTVAVLSLAIFLLGGWALAAGGSDAVLETTEFSVDSTFGFESGEQRAVCPAHQRALGGGVIQSGAPEGAVASSGPLDASGRIGATRDGDKAKQWYTSITNYSSEARNFKVFAICSAESSATLETKVFRTVGNAPGHATVKCSRGTRVLGGGILSPFPSQSPDDSTVIASGPLAASGGIKTLDDGDKAKRWFGAASINDTQAERTKFKVFAICASGSKATVERTRFDVGSPGTGDDRAECPADRRVVGGGVLPAGDPASRFYVRASAPLDAQGEMESTDDGEVAAQWYAAIFNYPGGQTRNFNVFAICEP